LPIIECIHDLNRWTDDDMQLGISRAEASQLRALLCRMRSNPAATWPAYDPPRRRGANGSA